MQNVIHLAPIGGDGLRGPPLITFFLQLLLHIQGFSLSLKSDCRGMPRIPALIDSPAAVQRWRLLSHEQLCMGPRLWSQAEGSPTGLGYLVLGP